MDKADDTDGRLRITATALAQGYACPLRTYHHVHHRELRRAPEPFRRQIMERGRELEAEVVAPFQLVSSAWLLNLAQGVEVPAHRLLLAGSGATETFQLTGFGHWMAHFLDEARAARAEVAAG